MTETIPDRFAVFDSETTGLSPRYGHRMLQLAIVEVDSSGNVLDHWSSFMNPERPVAATHVHGITQDMVDDAPTFRELWSEVEQRFQGRVLVAHNIRFDLGFLGGELSRFEIEWPFDEVWTFDTVSLGHLVPGAVNRRQQSLAKALGVDPEAELGRGAHDALTDALVASRVLRYYLENFPDEVNRRIRPLRGVA